MKQKSILFLATLVVGVLVSGSFVLAQGAVQSWLWSSGVTTNPPGYEGMGWISATSNNLSSDDGSLYAVDIPGADGSVTGYAWSEHYGWIDFQPTTMPAPDGTTTGVIRSGNFLTGWARIVAIQNAGANNGGWQGWIHMNGTGYGVDLDSIQNNADNGYSPGDVGYQPTHAWSDELGWIDFGMLGGTFPNENLYFCIGGNKIGSLSRTIGLGASETITSHYGPLQDCTEDVTADWTEDDTDPTTAISIAPASPANTNQVTVTGDNTGSESMAVSYDPGTGIITKILQYSVIVGGGPGLPSDPSGERGIWKEVTP